MKEGLSAAFRYLCGFQKKMLKRMKKKWIGIYDITVFLDKNKENIDLWIANCDTTPGVLYFGIKI